MAGTVTQKSLYFNASQQENFISFLISLGESEEKAISEALFYKLEEIYSDRKFKAVYHHYYSDIQSALVQIQNNPRKYSLDILGQNLQLIKTRYKVQKIDIKDEIEHLYDHSNLEISRMNNSLKVQKETKSYIERLAGQVEDSQKQFNKLSAKSEEINKKLDSSKIDYIAILGIFASIVLGFVGSMAFSTSVLQNMKDVSIYRLIAVSCVIGMVFINIVGLLVHFISELAGKNTSPLYYIFPNAVFVAILFSDLIIGCHFKGVFFF